MHRLSLRDNFDTVNVTSSYPAAGKGTLTAELRRVLHAQDAGGHVEVGSIVRGQKAQRTTIGLLMQQFEERGEMVPDDIIVPLVGRRVKGSLPGPLILDGFPRNKNQIASYHSLIQSLDRTDRFVHLEIPRGLAEERMVRRGASAQADGRTPRKDDIDPNTRRERLDSAERDMGPVIDYADARGVLVRIDASKSPEDVQQAVWDALFECAPILDDSAACAHELIRHSAEEGPVVQ